jgi:hypothetical protein
MKERECSFDTFPDCFFAVRNTYDPLVHFTNGPSLSAMVCPVVKTFS